MAREPYDEVTYVMVDDQLVECLGPRCVPRREDIAPKPRTEVPTKKPTTKPTAEKPGTKRPGGRTKPCVITESAPPKVSRSRSGASLGGLVDGVGRLVIVGVIALGLVLLGMLALAVGEVVLAWLPTVLVTLVVLAVLGIGYVAVNESSKHTLSTRVRFAVASGAEALAQARQRRTRAQELQAQATRAIPMPTRTETQEIEAAVLRGCRTAEIDAGNGRFVYSPREES